MATPKPLPDLDLLRSILDYDPDTGVITWLPRPQNTWFNENLAGKPVGLRKNGAHYLMTISGVDYALGRIAFKLAYGRDPAPGCLIDHINGSPIDNRKENLREVTPRQNAWNSVSKNSATGGLKGVCTEVRNPKTGNIKYRARIRVGGKKVSLGVFDTEEEAHAAYTGASIILQGEYALAARNGD